MTDCIPFGKLTTMGAMTTMKLSVEVRDRLMALATGHGRTLGTELAALVDEAEERNWWHNAKQAAARLQADAEQWGDYLREADDWNVRPTRCGPPAGRVPDHE